MNVVIFWILVPIVTAVVAVKLANMMLRTHLKEPSNEHSKEELENIVRMYAPQIIDDEWERRTRR